jgi:hypothetical protein
MATLTRRMLGASAVAALFAASLAAAQSPQTTIEKVDGQTLSTSPKDN